jgi:hypothetical protein
MARTGAPIIDTILILNHNIFDPGIPSLGPLPALVDAIHVRTHASVIRRMLFLNQGEPYDSARTVESARALRALNVFRDVTIDTVRLAGRLALRVVTADGWSTKPQWNYSSAGGDVSWAAGLEEDNLLGSATSLTALYSVTPDRTSQSFAYFNPHFIARRPRLLGVYQDFSDGRRGSWFLGVPFYETATPLSLVTYGEAATQRVLSFRDGLLSDDEERYALRFTAGGGVALRATSRNYLRLWFTGAWRREDFVPESVTVVPRSVSGTVGAGIELAQTRFHVLQEFNTYARREDVNLSHVLRLGLWAAPAAWGYPTGQAGVGAEASGQVSSVWPGGFVVLRAATNGVYNGTSMDSARARGGVTIASQNVASQTLIVHFEGGVLRRPKPGGQFDTWLDQTGPRLFGAHAFTGTRTVWITVEDRVLVVDELWGLVGVGVAPFLDWGGAWYDDEMARTGSDLGLALRLGPTRANFGEVQEFAVGWRFGAGLSRPGWALSVRRGIIF